MLLVVANHFTKSPKIKSMMTQTIITQITRDESQGTAS